MRACYSIPLALGPLDAPEANCCILTSCHRVELIVPRARKAVGRQKRRVTHLGAAAACLDYISAMIQVIHLQNRYFGKLEKLAHRRLEAMQIVQVAAVFAGSYPQPGRLEQS